MENILIIVIALFLPLFFIVSFLKPKYGLFLLLLSRPILDNINPLRINKIPIIDINVLQAIGLILPFTLLTILVLKKFDAAKKDVYFFQNSLSNYYVIYLLACVPSVLLADKTFLMAADWLRLFTLWTILVYALNVLENKKDLIQVLFVIVLSSFYPLTRFLIDFLMGNYVVVGDVSVKRILGGYFHQGMAARTLLMFIPAYLFFICNKEGLFFKKFLYVFAFVLVLISIYFTFFRTVLLALSVLLFSFIFFRRNYKILVALTVFTIIGIVSSPYLLNRVVYETYTALVHVNELLNPRATPYDYLLSFRFDAWRKLLTTYVYRSNILDVLFGFGYDLPAKGISVDIAHNQIIQTIFRFGTISLIAFYFFLYKVIVFAIKRNNTLIPQVITSYLLALLCSSFAGALFNDVRTLWYFGPYLAILIKYHAFSDPLNTKITD